MYADNPADTYSTGLWTVMSGTGILDNPTAFDAILTNLEPGSNELDWTVTRGTCSESNQIFIVSDMVFVDAGPDDELCSSSYFLQGNNPSGTGLWTVTLGSGVVTNSALYNSEMTISGATDIEVEWAIT